MWVVTKNGVVVAETDTEAEAELVISIGLAWCRGGVWGLRRR